MPNTPTVAEVAREILLFLCETVDTPQLTIPSGFWEVAEIEKYFDERQNRFLTLTGLCLRRVRLVAFNAPKEWTLPDDWLATYRVTWLNELPDPRGFRIDEYSDMPETAGLDNEERSRFNSIGFSNAAGVVRNSREVPRGDHWELDHADRDWGSTTVTFPAVYTEVEKPPKIIEVAPAAAEVGSAPEILYAAAAEPAQISNAALPAYTPTIKLSIPHEFVPAIRWGVISDMLAKPGRAFDPERADYAEQRFQEGIIGARLMLRGWQ